MNINYLFNFNMPKPTMYSFTLVCLEFLSQKPFPTSFKQKLQLAHQEEKKNIVQVINGNIEFTELSKNTKATEILEPILKNINFDNLMNSVYKFELKEQKLAQTMIWKIETDFWKLPKAQELSEYKRNRISEMKDIIKLLKKATMEQELSDLKGKVASYFIYDDLFGKKIEEFILNDMLVCDNSDFDSIKNCGLMVTNCVVGEFESNKIVLICLVENLIRFHRVYDIRLENYCNKISKKN